MVTDNEIKELEKQREQIETEIRNNKRIHAIDRIIKSVKVFEQCRDYDSQYEVYKASIEFVANFRHVYKKHKFVTNKELKRRG